MSLEIFYFRDENGDSVVEETLKRLSPKAFARSLAQIDLLESGEDLPAKLNQTAQEIHLGAKINSKGDADVAEPEAKPAPDGLRFLISRADHNRARFYYIALPDDRLVIVDVVEGKKPRKARLGKLSERAAQAAEDQGASLKSHREYVAESTLGDPDLAALYARARERAALALALIRLREAASHTPESLAERTGLSREHILNVERGHVPKLATLRRLADALHAQILIAPGCGLAIAPAPAPPDKPVDGEAALTTQAKPPAKSRSSAAKQLPASKAAKPKPNAITRPAAARPAPHPSSKTVKPRKPATPGKPSGANASAETPINPESAEGEDGGA